mgnify:CR=1 FL=1
MSPGRRMSSSFSRVVRPLLVKMWASTRMGVPDSRPASTASLMAAHPGRPHRAGVIPRVGSLFGLIFVVVSPRAGLAPFVPAAAPLGQRATPAAWNRVRPCARVNLPTRVAMGAVRFSFSHSRRKARSSERFRPFEATARPCSRASSGPASGRGRHGRRGRRLGSRPRPCTRMWPNPTGRFGSGWRAAITATRSTPRPSIPGSRSGPANPAASATGSGRPTRTNSPQWLHPSRRIASRSSSG